MMKRDKILLQVDSLDDIEDYAKLGITNFLFPLQNFSVGYTSFAFAEIESTGVDAYILMNRLLTDADIDAFADLTIPHNVRGFVIEDTGLYEILKEKGYTLINFQNHLNANYETCNFWLELFDSLVTSTDITESELEEIVEHTAKPLVLYTFGYPMIMYSRRHLISNYYENLGLTSKSEITLEDPKGEFTFRLKETEYGTACFDTKILDARSEHSRISEAKVLFYLLNAAGISKDDIVRALNEEEVEGTTKGFLTKKTVYRIGDLK